MKFIKVNKLGVFEGLPDLVEVSARLDKLSPRWNIGELNWDEFNYKPMVEFVMAYSNNELFIKYYVKEKFVKADKTTDNEMVCKDSCVEFFVSPADDGYYYNFEFNAIGTCYLGHGSSRQNSSPVDTKIVGGVRRLPSIGNTPFKERKGDQEWELTVGIPLELIFGKKEPELSGKRIKANFYKCGDDLSQPHYLTWNKVQTKEPDYHRPDYFGEILFE